MVPLSESNFKTGFHKVRMVSFGRGEEGTHYGRVAPSHLF